VAARSKAWVCGRSLVGIAVSNPAGGQGCLTVVDVVYCQVELSTSGWSLVQRSLPIVVCPNAIVKFRSGGDPGPLGAVAFKDKSSNSKKKTLYSILPLFHYCFTRIHHNRSVYHVYFHGPTFPSGPHHSVCFTITLKPTTHGRTPLEEWSAEHSELYLTTHSTYKRQGIRVPGEIRTCTPSKRATANPGIRPHGDWERLCHYNRTGFRISSWCQTVSCVHLKPSCCICLHPCYNVEVWCRQCFPAALKRMISIQRQMSLKWRKISVGYLVTKWKALWSFLIDSHILRRGREVALLQ